LISIGIFGASLFFGDGIITPAISVLSAVEGLETAAPGLQPYVIPLTIGILIGLFLIQHNGTASISKLFGPVMLVWFLTLAVLGVIHIHEHPDVLLLINPYYAIRFIAEHGMIAFVVLGAVVLTVTGGEALYADMGHFGRGPIRSAWFFVVLPALLLNYCGQGAILLSNPAAVENPFFHMAPPWALYPLVALATLAAVIASQAVISGVFSIARQAVQLGYLPRMDIRHTSAREIGQIYIPSFNWILLGLIIILVLTFRSSSNLASAYGIAVTLTMICDTVLAVVVAYKLWHWNRLLLVAIALPLLIVDFGFFISTSFKILQGGWFPLLAGVLVYTIMSTWKRGRKILFDHLSKETMPLNLFINGIGGGAVHEVPGTAVFMTSSHSHVPHALLHNLKHNKILHERNMLLTVITQDVPFVADGDRLQIERIAHNFWLMTAYYGFKEEPQIPLLFDLCAAKGLEFNMMDTSFFLSRERIVSGLHLGMMRWREKLFAAMFRNAASATDFFHIPGNRVVELGAQVMM
jgi:KUP system potassium uptake protein